MLVWTIGLVVLLLLALVAEPLAGRVFAQRQTLLQRCERCNLGFPRELIHAGHCPYGHAVGEAGAVQARSATGVMVAVCVAFLIVAGAMVLTGMVPAP